MYVYFCNNKQLSPYHVVTFQIDMQMEVYWEANSFADTLSRHHAFSGVETQLKVFHMYFDQYFHCGVRNTNTAFMLYCHGLRQLTPDQAGNAAIIDKPTGRGHTNKTH